MKVNVRHGIGDLAKDQAAIVRRAPRELRATVRQGARLGNQLAQDNARRTSGRHGRRYPRSFTYEARPTYALFGALVYLAEYGPDSSRPQGGMSFEEGSRNQKPHWDLAKSADVIGPALAQEVGETVARLFREPSS